VNRDNLLFALLGLVLGFISAYWMFEAMATRQPARLVPGAVAADPHQGLGPGAGQPPGQAAGQGAPGAPGAGEQGMMEDIQQLRQRVAENPNDADAVLRLANANFDIQNWQRARELYMQYLKLRPNEPDVITDLGITYRATGEYDQALGFFRQAQGIAPQHWQSRFNEAVVLAFDLKQFEKAEEILADLRRMQPDNPNIQQLAAEIERQRNAA
jgi:tetratricopeptide (TPR) repeat protein